MQNKAPQGSWSWDIDALTLKEGCTFVFGGDCFDKGPHDIRLSQQLVSLKKRYPGRVALLLGMLWHDGFTGDPNS